jgi:Holliday junction resolvase-like predicted endonuclease
VRELPANVGDPALPWYWEGNVQAQVVNYLVAEGWTIKSVANTAQRQRGIDIVATKADRHIAVEVKGFPSTVYARGENAGQPKRTKPNLQARHWLAEALLTGILIADAGTHTEVALAFPAVPRYRDLLRRIRHGIERLGFRVLICEETGVVRDLTAPDASW